VQTHSNEQPPARKASVKRAARAVAAKPRGDVPVSLDRYELSGAFDEMFQGPGIPRPAYRSLCASLASWPADDIVRRQRAADAALVNQGITFSLSGPESSTDRVLPYDILPRIIDGAEWSVVSRGLEQRIRALNLFLHDVYNDGRIFADRVVPRELVYTCKHYRRDMRGIRLPLKRYVAVAGTDLIRLLDGSFAVLEDNVRVPSGVSYMLANRQISKSLFPALFHECRVSPIEHYARNLLATLKEMAPTRRNDPTVVVLTPGYYNSAYFEHAFLARQMGVELVQGQDLVVHDNGVFMRTTAGLRRVDVIYRRIDDDFLDPLAFRSDSYLGVPGLYNAYRAGGVNIGNAVGTGVADDKAVYAYVPAIIRYYLREDPILSNVETYLASDPAHRSHILANLDSMVVKAVGEAGGYGMLMGPFATNAEREEFRGRIEADPRNYIAQPVAQFSCAPCFIDGAIEPRHVDLRPFVLHGREVRIVAGGLTRVALRRGSLVVNSSQGGGTKDTWVVTA
jgi:uncharacterized circularly permuted ATP-grasp superfamily protein